MEGIIPSGHFVFGTDLTSYLRQHTIFLRNRHIEYGDMCYGI